MTAPGQPNGHPVDATVALRRPDGGRFTVDDVDGLLPTTLLVVEIDARTGDGVTDSADGQVTTVVTCGRVIGWIPPAQAPFGRSMLTGAVQAVHQATAGLGRHAAPAAPTTAAAGGDS